MGCGDEWMCVGNVAGVKGVVVIIIVVTSVYVIEAAVILTSVELKRVDNGDGSGVMLMLVATTMIMIL